MPHQHGVFQSYGRYPACSDHPHDIKKDVLWACCRIMAWHMQGSGFIQGHTQAAWRPREQGVYAV